MTTVLPKPSQGNAIVTPPTIQPFPTLLLSALVVGSGIWIADQFDSRAAWLLTFLVLLVVAFSYPTFATEIASLYSSPANKQQTGPTTPTPQPSQHIEFSVGPTGDIVSGVQP